MTTIDLLSLDRASHRRTDLAFLERSLGDGGCLLVPVYRDQNLISGERLSVLRLSEFPGLIDGGGELVWLGMVGETACFAVDISQDEATARAVGARGEWKDLRFVGAALPEADAAIAAYARGILYWHRRQRFCGVCGGETAPREGGHMRECRNEACAQKHFPRTDPAIIVLVEDGEGRCLLGRQRRWPAGMYSTLAGFVEPGETIEEAVAREVLEESGVRVQDVRYFRSQPWPFPSSLMIGFVARAATREISLGDDELEDARWRSRSEIRDSRAHGFFVPGRYSLAGQLIEAFLAADDPA